MLMRDAEGRKEDRSKQARKKQARSNKQTRQSNRINTPKAVTFSKKNELPGGIRTHNSPHVHVYVHVGNRTVPCRIQDSNGSEVQTGRAEHKLV